MNINATLFIAPLVEFIVSKVIESGTGGDKTKQYARAQEVVAINAALTMIDQGNPLGTAALAAAITGTTALSPGEAVALQSLFSIIGNQLTLLNTVAGGTILGGAAQAIATAILSAGTAAANAYPNPMPATTAAAS